jgi:lysophospholipase L1-like esterase
MADYTYAQAQTAGVAFIAMPNPVTTFGWSGLHLKVVGAELRFRFTGTKITIGGFPHGDEEILYSIDGGDNWTEVTYGTLDPANAAARNTAYATQTFAQGTYDIIVRVAARGSFTLFTTGVTAGDKFIQVAGAVGTVERYGGDLYCLRYDTDYIQPSVPAPTGTAGDVPVALVQCTGENWRLLGDFTSISVAQYYNHTNAVDGGTEYGGWVVYREDTGDEVANFTYPSLSPASEVKIFEIASGLTPNIPYRVFYKHHSETLETIFNFLFDGPPDATVRDTAQVVCVIGTSIQDGSTAAGNAGNGHRADCALISRFNGAGGLYELFNNGWPGASFADLNHASDPVTYPWPRNNTPGKVPAQIQQYCLSRLDGANADVALFVIGGPTNDVGIGGVTNQMVEDSYTFIIEQIRLSYPTTPILVIGCIPRGSYNPAGAYFASFAGAAEAAVDSFADPNTTYLEVYELLGWNTGNLSIKIPDNVHPSDEGYEDLANVIRAAVAATEPVIVPAGGTVAPGQEVTLTLADGETGYYTLDASTPTDADEEYDPDAKPTLDDEGDVTVKARAFVAGKLASTVAIQSFTVEAESEEGGEEGFELVLKPDLAEAMPRVLEWPAIEGAETYDVYRNGTVIATSLTERRYRGVFADGDDVQVVAKDGDEEEVGISIKVPVQ